MRMDAMPELSYLFWLEQKACDDRRRRPLVLL